ncbi:phosphatase IMPL1, chloroplastic isoform X2 [Lycium ferocissimum]|uniref:phosphatase IMPL1, chloroplastic isoform X2 n=1 Tax=Lycium ferocissimum TaxID=112874 RepID=UPI0028157F8E|nr:phosphatase IMPL1, chloroplastic isoform X2 [Lycium ferocissimum]
MTYEILVQTVILLRSASLQVEFVGGPMCWNTRTFSAAAGKGAFANGEKIHVSGTDKVEQSLLVTGFGYDHDDPWATNMELFKEFTDVSRVATLSFILNAPVSVLVNFILIFF